VSRLDIKDAELVYLLGIAALKSIDEGGKRSAKVMGFACLKTLSSSPVVNQR